MPIRTILIALAALAALGFSACGGGGGGVSSPGSAQGQPPSSGGTTSQAATRTYELGSAAGSYDLPPLGGFSGSLSLPAAAVPVNTRLGLTSYLQAPAGAPILQGAASRVRDTGTLNVYFYTTLTVSYSVTFPTLPGFSLTLPATVDATGLQFFYAISNPTPTDGAQVQFRTEGPATVSGQIVTFAPSTASLTLKSGQPYTVAFYAITAVAAKPTPSTANKIYVLSVPGGDNSRAFPVPANGILTTYNWSDGTQSSPTITTGLDGPRGVAVDAAGKIYVTNSGNGTVTTYTANGTPTTPTITGLHCPCGVAVDAAGKIYVANSGSGTVTVYAANGTPTTPTVAGLGSPVGVAVDGAGKIYVTNTVGFVGTVRTYNANGTPTTPTITGLHNPSGVAVDGAGKIYVADAAFDRIGFGSITAYDSAGTQTTPTIMYHNPFGVAVDAAGNIYDPEPFANGVGVYAANGTLNAVIAVGFPQGVAVH